MDNWYILIPAAIIFGIGLAVAIYKYISLKKTTDDLSFAGFITEYSANIIRLCKDVIMTLFDSDAYKDLFDEDGVVSNDEVLKFSDTMIDLAYDKLVSECELYDIDPKYIKIFDTKTIKLIVSTVVKANRKEILPAELVKDDTDELAAIEAAELVTTEEPVEEETPTETVNISDAITTEESVDVSTHD